MNLNHKIKTTLTLMAVAVLAAAVHLEVVEARVERDLARGHRQRFERDAGQLQVDEVAQFLDRPELGL